MKKIFIATILTLSFASAHAQRFSLTELLEIYKLACSSPFNSSSIDSKIRNKGANWSAMLSKQKDTQLTLRWIYTFDNSARGIIYILKDDDPIFPKRMIFQFPYKVQYEDYLSTISKDAELVNVLTENGKQIKVFETNSLVITLAVFPPELKRYFDEGVPAPFYEIYFQSKAK